MFLVRGKLKKQQRCNEVRNIEFISKQPCQFFVFTLLSPQFKFGVHPCILIKLCCLIPFSKYQSLFLLALEVKCARYLHSLPIHFLISLFPVICFELSVTQTFSEFELSGVDCIKRLSMRKPCKRRYSAHHRIGSNFPHNHNLVKYR